MKRLVAIAIRLMPSPVVSSRMWKSTCLRLSIRAATFESAISSESESRGAAAFGLAGILVEVPKAARSRAVVNSRVNSLLNSSMCKALPTSPSSPRKRKEVSKARTSTPLATILGSLGSLLSSNLVPPMKIGTLVRVSGMRMVASPRLGIRIIATMPRSIKISGSSSMVVSRSISVSIELMASTPVNA